MNNPEESLILLIRIRHKGVKQKACRQITEKDVAPEVLPQQYPVDTKLTIKQHD